MELSWLQSLIVGLISGFTDILPVSAQAHRTVLLTVFGQSGDPALLRLMIHLATLAALYYSCRVHIVRIQRQWKLSRIPKRRRKRPVDMRTLLDFKLLQTTLIPIILGFFVYAKTSSLNSSLMWGAIFLFANGVLLFIPMIVRSGNKDSQNMSPLDGLTMGLGSAVGLLPGMSSVGASTALGSLCGADRTYALNMSLLMHMVVTIGLIIFDIFALFTGHAGIFSFGILMRCIFAGIAAFAGTFLGIRVSRSLAANSGFSVFAFYCWGAALFSFIMYLSAA